MPRRLRSPKVWVLMFAVGWLGMIVILLANSPAPGASSPDELALQVGEALHARDAKKLQPLVSVGGEEVAKATVEKFGDVQVRDTRFVGDAIIVEFVRADGSPGDLRMPATEADGRWQVTPLAVP